MTVISIILLVLCFDLVKFIVPTTTLISKAQSTLLHAPHGFLPIPLDPMHHLVVQFIFMFFELGQSGGA